ncbi:MAG: GNAT family N-acetyltransferase [Pirellulaceae bacterium]
MPPLVRLSEIADSDAALSYAGLTYPTYQPLLLGLRGDARRLAVGAEHAGQPVGLALAVLGENEKHDAPSAEIVSLFVAKSHRGQGIGGSLLAEIERRMAAAGVRNAAITYPSGERPTAGIERMLARQGWSTPKPRMHLLRLGPDTHRTVRQAKWLAPRPLPEGCSLFPWTTLSDEERDELLDEQRRSPWFPAYISPFREAQLEDESTSLGLRYRGRVSGWMVTHRIQPDVLRYTSLFVRPEVPGRGVGLHLLREAITRHLDTAPDARRSTLGVAAGNPVWGFLQRRLMPVAEVESLVTTMTANKQLLGG